MRIAVHAHSKPNLKLKKMWNKTQINVPYTTVLLVQFTTAKLLYKKHKVTIKPKYKENFLLHERTKKIYISIRLCVLRNHKLINSNIVLYNGTIFKYSKNDKKNQLIVINWK